MTGLKAQIVSTASTLRHAGESILDLVRFPSTRRFQVVNPVLRSGPYCVRLAESIYDRRAAFRLRFRVFNLEMNEGLESAFSTGEDRDAYDEVCDHLIVRHEPSDQVVGTYRLQTGATAERNFGYYSAWEFEFAPYEPLRSQTVELGRACI